MQQLALFYCIFVHCGVRYQRCVLIGMYFNEDTRMSLFVGIIFMLAVTAIYKVFGLNRHGKAHKLEE